MVFCISPAIVASSDDIRHALPCIGIPVLRHRHDRYTAYTPPRIKFCLLVGSDFILHLRFFFSGDGNDPVLQALSNLFPFTSLFPDLCLDQRSTDTAWLTHGPTIWHY